MPVKSSPPPAAKPNIRKLKYPVWEVPAGSGIKVAEMPNRTKGRVYGVSYQVRVPAQLLGKTNRKVKDKSGKTRWIEGRELHQRSTKAEAFRLAEDRFLALKAYGTEFAKIPADAQRAAAIGWGILNEHNTRTGLSLELVEVVKAGIRALSPEGGRKTLSDVVAELTALKKERLASGGIGSNTVHDFEVRCGRIVAYFGTRFVSDILHTEVKEWLRKLRSAGAQFGGGGLSVRSVKNYRNTLAEVLKHATARRYCTDNPFTHFTREDFKALGGENSERDLDSINILTVEEARKLLKAAQESTDAGMLASTVLRLFCGIRTTEVCRLDWSEVHWLDPKPYVHIPAGKAKKRRIRHVDIPENALEWLKLCNPPAKGRIVPGTEDPRTAAKYYCVRFRRVVKAAGIGKETDDGDWQSEWESNDTRHSFGSYHYALHGDALRTAGQMGHKQNDDVLFAHYRSQECVSKERADAYFAIRPEVAASKVTQFPKAAAVAG